MVIRTRFDKRRQTEGTLLRAQLLAEDLCTQQSEDLALAFQSQLGLLQKDRSYFPQP